MNYEKRYNELIDAIKEMMEANPHDEGLQNWVHDNVPELTESEDERIRKALLELFSNACKKDWRGIPNEKIVDWLERQGGITKSNEEEQGGITNLSEEEQNRFAKGILSNCALSFINYLDANKYESKMCVSDGECEDIENAFHNAMWDRLHRYYCKYIEKQDEQKPFAPKSAIEVIKEEKVDNANKVE